MKKILAFFVFFAFITTIASAVQVSKQDWIEGVTVILPVAFCRDEQYFRQCFNISQEECEKVATSAARVCIQKYKEEIPEELNQPEDGAHWGSIIGKCAGEAYEVTLIQEKIDNEKCNNSENWM